MLTEIFSLALHCCDIAHYSTLIRILASKAVAAMRYHSTRQLKLQYQITYTEKGTGLRVRLMFPTPIHTFFPMFARVVDV